MEWKFESGGCDWDFRAEKIKSLIKKMRDSDFAGSIGDIVEIEFSRYAGDCIVCMPPLEVRDACYKLNKRLNDILPRERVDELIAEMWQEKEFEGGQSQRANPLTHMQEFEKEVKSWTSESAFGFGIHHLDMAYGGLMPGELGVVVGAQGSMKTSLAVKGAEEYLNKNASGRVLFFSLDMTPAELVCRFLMRRMGVSLSELYGMIRGDDDAYLREKKLFDEWGRGRLGILGNGHSNRWTIDGFMHQVAMKLPSLVVVDFLTCLKKQGQSDLDGVEEIMPRVQSITQKLGIKTLLLSQMSRASKTEQLKGASGGHSKGGGIVEELAHMEIELLRDAPEVEGDPPNIIATVTKTRRGISGTSLMLDYTGKSMAFTGRAMRVSKDKERKPIFSAIDPMAELRGEG